LLGVFFFLTWYHQSVFSPELNKTIELNKKLSVVQPL